MSDSADKPAKNLAEKLAGKFIVIDGPDGSGKTTQLRALREYLSEAGALVEVMIDPGTTKIGQKIRALLLDRDNGEISPMCETFLFMASRAQLVLEYVKPAIKEGKVVLCDRFVSATIAYQGASGVDKETIFALANHAIANTWPDLTVILDVPVKTGFDRLGIDRQRLKKPQEEELQRAGGAPKKGKREKEARLLPWQGFLFGDRMEIRSSTFHEKVRALFKELSRDYPGKVRCVDADGDEKLVFDRILEAISEEFHARSK